MVQDVVRELVRHHRRELLVGYSRRESPTRSAPSSRPPRLRSRRRVRARSAICTRAPAGSSPGWAHLTGSPQPRWGRWREARDRKLCGHQLSRCYPACPAARRYPPCRRAPENRRPAARRYPPDCPQQRLHRHRRREMKMLPRRLTRAGIELIERMELEADARLDAVAQCGAGGGQPPADLRQRAYRPCARFRTGSPSCARAGAEEVIRRIRTPASRPSRRPARQCGIQRNRGFMAP